MKGTGSGLEGNRGLEEFFSKLPAGPQDFSRYMLGHLGSVALELAALSTQRSVATSSISLIDFSLNRHRPSMARATSAVSIRFQPA